MILHVKKAGLVAMLQEMFPHTDINYITFRSAHTRRRLMPEEVRVTVLQ
jgi:hypothetical protein